MDLLHLNYGAILYRQLTRSSLNQTNLVGIDYVGRLTDAEVMIEGHMVEEARVRAEHLLTEQTRPKQIRGFLEINLADFCVQ